MHRHRIQAHWNSCKLKWSWAFSMSSYHCRSKELVLSSRTNIRIFIPHEICGLMICITVNQWNNLLTPASLLCRYLKIIHPLGNHILQTVQAARIISTVTWVFLLAITTSYITLFTLTQPELTNVPDTCDPLQSAKVIVFDKIIHTCSAAVFLFVFVSMVFFYYSASRSVLLAQQRQPASSSCKKLMKSRKKMLVLVSVFCICFVPYHLVRLPYTFLRRRCSLSLMLYYLKETTILLSVLNICLDPLIYFIFCEAFRAQLSRPHSKKARRRSEGQPRATNSEASPSTSTRQTDGL